MKSVAQVLYRRLRATSALAPAFSPASLFASGEQGFWYDTSDLTTMFKDAAGTQPCELEQPVMLRLDKSKGLVLGSELVTNGDFSNGTTGWTLSAGTATVSSGQVSIAGATTRYLSQSFTTVVGRTYRVRGTIVTAGATFNAIRKSDNSTAGSNVVTILSAAGTGEGVFVATATTTFIVLQVNDAGTAVFDNISVRELPGNHAVQITSANAPVLSARKNRLANTETLSTQNVTVRAVGHVLSFWGTGTVTLSGVSTAGPLVGTSANDRVYLAFTPTAGTLTLTVSGTVSKAQLEEVNEAA